MSFVFLFSFDNFDNNTTVITVDQMTYESYNFYLYEFSKELIILSNNKSVKIKDYNVIVL